MLKKELVTKEQFLGTYGKSRDKQYEKALNGEGSTYGIANEFGVHQHTVRRWLNGRAKPQSLKGFEKVAHLFPLTASHPNFPQVNKLTAWALFSGNIGKKFDIALVEDKKKLKEPRKLLSEIGVKSRFAMTENRIKLHGKENAAQLGRILVLLGAKEKRKIPEYVKALAQHARNAEKREEREIARSHLNDFLGVFTKTRFISGKREGNYWSMPELKERKNAESEAKRMQDLIASALGVSPEIRIYGKTRKHGNVSRTNCEGRLKLNAEQMRKIRGFLKMHNG